MKSQTARMLFYDLEVSPTLGWTYGVYDTRVLKVEKQPVIMSVSWRWYDEKKTKHASISVLTVKDLVELIRNLFDEADIVVAHNANRFDNKVATAAFIKYNLTPPSPYKTIDTLRVLRGVSRFNSNGLDAIGEELGIGTKSTIKHSDLWYGCLNGDAEAWKLLKKYNNKDVEILVTLYERLRPYIKNHTNLGDLSGERGICPKCGSAKLEKRGVKYQKQTYQCKDCFGWCNDSSKKLSGRIVNG